MPGRHPMKPRPEDTPLSKLLSIRSARAVARSCPNARREWIMAPACGCAMSYSCSAAKAYPRAIPSNSPVAIFVSPVLVTPHYSILVNRLLSRHSRDPYLLGFLPDVS